MGISQAELCRRADVSESTVSRAKSISRELTPRIRARLDRALSAIAQERGVTIVDVEEGRDAAE